MKKKVYGFTKYYTGGKTPPRVFLYDSRKARDEGKRIAKGQKGVRRIDCFTDTVRG